MATVALGYFFSAQIKKYSHQIYIVASVVSLMAIIHASMILSGHSITYVFGLRQIFKAIDSGALGGAIFIVVMYLGAVNMKYKVSKKLRVNRAELSIIGGILIIPHNVHYLFLFIFSLKNLNLQPGMQIWTSLMMFISGFFAIAIMIPLFITSFKTFRVKMSAKKWKHLQEYAYIFYAMIFIQVIMLYISKPGSFNKYFNLVLYVLIFGSYTYFRLQKKFKFSLSETKFVRKLKGAI